MRELPVRTADVVIVGAGVQGAALAFHLARRGARVAVLDRTSVGAGATGSSSGFVRMHYDLLLEAELAWRSFPWFTDWAERVGAGDCGFVRTGFLQLVPPGEGDALRANVAAQQGIGIATSVVTAGEAAAIVPGMRVDGVGAGAWEPLSGYADPTGTAAGLLAAARRHGAAYGGGLGVTSVRVDGDRVTGVVTEAGELAAPVVVDAAGAWAASVARTAGVEVPLVPWRHDTAYLGLPGDRPEGIPIVLDHARSVYFRPEGHDLLLAGLEDGNETGGSPDRPLGAPDDGLMATLVDRVVSRVPWMAGGDFRSAARGQDGMTPDQRPILGPAGGDGPDGLVLCCGFSGTGFKTAPAIGESLAEWILDGEPRTVDLRPFALGRFATGDLLEGEHPYQSLWR
jgi:sarcosine oxidase subunit beta